MSGHQRRTWSGRRTSIVRAVAWVGVVGLLLVGCGRIPTSGPVYHYNEPDASASSASPAFSPSGPQNGASPSEILNGFIKAGTGVENDYSVAREYLTTELAGSWKPEDRTLVYSDDVKIDSGQSDQQATAEVNVSTSIDGRGIATSFRNPDKQQVAAKFTQVNGQWRIASIPNGTMLSRSEFEQLFRSFTLYFYDPTFSYAVPDIRWFANRSTVATSVVRVLLQGPAPYLEGAVATAVPNGTSLMRQSVPISNSSAEVGLAGTDVSDANQLTLERLNTQLEQTLKSTNSVESVRLSVDDKAVETGKLGDYQAATINPQVPSPQVGVLEGDLVTYADGQSRKVSGLAPSQVQPSMPTMDSQRRVYAYTDEDREHLAVRTTSGKALDTDMEESITAPSVDTNKWVWAGGTEGSVYALDSGGDSDEPQKVEADWLRDQHIQSLRISRDGSRALVVTGEGDNARVWVSGIKRNAQGAPESLGEPLRVGTTRNATQASWISDTDVVVANTQDGTVQTVSLAGETNDVNGLSDIEHISGGNGKDSIYAQTSTDTYSLTGTSWTRVDTKVRDLAYSG
ncbi:LpqB family beta-propeller domain-containing protein [Rothia uropygioeca]|uniref:LpqB family beta-propeller domain-containing protein n=1 Tax=Kocuria sp. 257 TaxID=2021970 RepID=UPI001011B1D1|nr:LpqB family beta-propeller domain-containing protein [Kocuria sp. 257]